MSGIGEMRRIRPFVPSNSLEKEQLHRELLQSQAKISGCSCGNCEGYSCQIKVSVLVVVLSY